MMLKNIGRWCGRVVAVEKRDTDPLDRSGKRRGDDLHEVVHRRLFDRHWSDLAVLLMET